MTRAGVLIEREQNVAFIHFLADSPPPEPATEDDAWWPWDGEPVVEAGSGKTSRATRPLPARWSPRPVRVLRRRFRRSQLAADLRQWAWLVGVLSAAVLVLVAGDYLNRLLGGLS